MQIQKQTYIPTHTPEPASDRQYSSLPSFSFSLIFYSELFPPFRNRPSLSTMYKRSMVCSLLHSPYKEYKCLCVRERENRENNTGKKGPTCCYSVFTCKRGKAAIDETIKKLDIMVRKQGVCCKESCRHTHIMLEMNYVCQTLNELYL